MSTSNPPGPGPTAELSSPADTPANLQSSEGSEPGLEHPEPLGSLEPNVPEVGDWQLRGELAFGNLGIPGDWRPLAMEVGVLLKNPSGSD